MILVDLERVGVRRPDRPLFESLSLTVSTGDRLGVVGVNGTGKSTLLRVLAGVAEPESGTVRRSRGLRVGFLDQQPTLPAGSVRSAVGAAQGRGCPPDNGGGSRHGLGGGRDPGAAGDGRARPTPTSPRCPAGRPNGWRWPGCW